MPDFKVSIQIEDEFESLVSATWIVAVIEKTLDVCGAPTGTSVDVMIAGDELVRGLNYRHRGLDETTDVLSFSFEHHGQYYGEGQPLGRKGEKELFILPPDEPHMIGEVVISYQQATRQSEEANRQIDDEILSLLIHGLLHLMGYDHETSEEEKKMSKIATEASSALKSAGYLPIGELG